MDKGQANKNSKGKATATPPSHKASRPIPWWINIILAAGGYCSFKYLLPGLQLENPTFQKLTQAAPSFAPLITIPFLLLAAKQLYDSDIRKDGPELSEKDQDQDPEA